ncbi:MAG: PilZ domain-containing protein [Marinicellaceae bacterium]
MSKIVTPESNRRQFTRLPFVSKVQLYSGTSAWDCEIVDISLKGVLFSKPSEQWTGKLNEIYRISISLSNSPTISMNIEIVHIGENNIGAKWNKIDVDSFSRLKRLLELNTIERNRITKEIGYL